ncbi:DMT family transporter [Phytohabitans sp. ZYX-F-186]|uniref:DMT family transporter n=1 Tax=Phytohabitans maris TaxID=3071409 RepID=A0ABU0ZAN2_9ACTN|nr:DMT family transporter [Phytohabitans sp. ZYX-F-186]MDQ7903504.1 DMT family transporter [Phytohabitans sp. ZYX-F-186]
MTRRAWAQLLVLAALWGAVYPLIEVALRGLSPVVVVLGRVVLAAALLTPLAIRRGALRRLWKHPRAIIETALVQSTIPLLLLTFGQEYVSAGIAGILIGAQPLFVALLAVRYAPDERPQGLAGVVGVTLGLVGLLLLFGVDLSGGAEAVVGGVLVSVAAVGYATGSIMIHKRHADAPPLGVATSAMLVTTTALAVPALFSIPAQPPQLSAVAALAVLGVVCTGVTLVMFYTLIAQTGPARAALAFYLSPAFAVAFGAVFLDEPISITAIAGLVAIIAGSILAARRAEPAPT